MNNNRMPHVVMLRIAAVLLVLVMLTTCIISGRFARYVSTASGEDSARVAKFNVTQKIIHNAQVFSETWALDILPGEKPQFRITVSNDSEVAVRNTVTVTNVTGNLPLTFRVSKADSGEFTAGSCAASFDMAPGTTTEDYIITVYWPNDETALDYIGMVDKVSIQVVSAQID